VVRTAVLNPKYYREQARILSSWALAARDARVAAQLSMRAQNLLQLSEQAKVPTASPSDAFDVFNSSQMTRRPV
jgi:hypothetical protein